MSDACAGCLARPRMHILYPRFQHTALQIMDGPKYQKRA